MATWKDIEIWQRLLKIKNPEAEEVRSFLSSNYCLIKIEKILNKGGTSPKDFTLHDADHSFRVAERMWEIIPANTKKILSEYELALLLLSAYLHDIGMTPEFKKVSNHFSYLATKSKNTLEDTEKKDFQKWLDEEGERIDIESDVVEDSEKVTELITLYCRHKHNDWSEEWIRNNFKNKSLANYTNWLNDLISICKSHHYGLEELKSDIFNPLKIHGKVIHKRYIAMCLRLADVIEIDPERAPEVLLKHRNVISGSISHWLKEKFTSIDLVNNSIAVTANPTKAFIHKAITDVADQIEHETNLCNTLNGEIPLRNIFPSNDLKHEWNILPSVYRNIKEAGNYEFIDGTFKPNSKKLLQLLAGTELYGNPILAIRELIQNSLDAVKVQIGYKILEDNLTKEGEYELLKSKYSIELFITKEGDDYWVNCRDNGVGMDKEIIKKCFLVGGATKRHELLELERKCNKINYNLELTGQFGIGVLSYFMIADKIIIKTKKSYQSGNHEQNGWEFEINGLSDFGELRKCSIESHGTFIKLRIKKEFISQIEDNSIPNLIERYLNRIPCIFRFTSLKINEISYTPGWCKDESYFRTKLVEQFNQSTAPEVNVASEFISEEIKSILETSEERKLAALERFTASIYFLSYEGKLQNNNGYYRVHVPIFKNISGDSFAFFFERIINDEIVLERINDGFLFYPKEKYASISWKGISIQNASNDKANFEYRNCFIEVDLTNEKSFQISVSRLHINYNSEFNVLLNEIKEKITSLILNNKEKFTESRFSFFNYIVVSSLGYNNNLFWTYDSGFDADTIRFEKIKFPLIFDISTDIGHPKNEMFIGSDFYRLSYLRSCGSNHSGKNFSINKYNFKFDKAVYHPYYNFRISFIISESFNSNNKFSFLGNSSDFPPEWQSLFCFRGYNENDIILNENSPYFKYITKADFMYVKDFFDKRKSVSDQHAQSIIKSKSRSFCFMLYLILLNKKSYWNGVTKNNNEFVKKLWCQMFEDDKESIYFFYDGIADIRVAKISIDSWTNITEINEIFKILPMPNSNWKIEKKPTSHLPSTS